MYTLRQLFALPRFGGIVLLLLYLTYCPRAWRGGGWVLGIRSGLPGIRVPACPFLFRSQVSARRHATEPLTLRMTRIGITFLKLLQVGKHNMRLTASFGN